MIEPDPKGFTWSEAARAYRCNECGWLVWGDTVTTHNHNTATPE